jgi:hypothetical protein
LVSAGCTGCAFVYRFQICEPLSFCDTIWLEVFDLAASLAAFLFSDIFGNHVPKLLLGHAMPFTGLSQNLT